MLEINERQSVRKRHNQDRDDDDGADFELVALILAGRYGLSQSHAKTVAELSGLGNCRQRRG